MIELNKLSKIVTQKPKRLGRGSGSGHGTTASRGTKGQKSRSGANIPARFQGGGLTLWQRLPKKTGNKSLKLKNKTLPLSLINKVFNEGETVSYSTLEATKLIKAKEIDKYDLKILFDEKLAKKLSLHPAIKVSKKVKEQFLKSF